MATDKLIADINEFVRKHIYFEFAIYSFSGNVLTIVGSPDMTYYHNLEIHLKTPFYLSGKFDWIADANSIAVAELDEVEMISFSKQNRIEVGNHSLKFKDQDGIFHYFTFKDVEISFNTVRYY